MSDTLTDGHHEWASEFCGIPTRDDPPAIAADASAATTAHLSIDPNTGQDQPPSDRGEGSADAAPSAADAGEEAPHRLGDVMPVLAADVPAGSATGVGSPVAQARASKDPKGSRKVDVQITLVNWDNAPIIGYQGLAEFKSPSAPVVNLGAEIKGGVISFAKIALMPQGTLRVIAVSLGEATTAPSGVVSYKLPEKGLMTFTAAQGRKAVKVSAKTSEEAANKVGVKGTVGIDYKIVKAEGEVSKETEKKQGSEVSIEWEVVQGLDSFDLKQVN